MPFYTVPIANAIKHDEYIPWLVALKKKSERKKKKAMIGICQNSSRGPLKYHILKNKNILSFLS